ncbi:MAG: ABC transporter substrate-binding protein [Terrimesophilobacter sp.]
MRDATDSLKVQTGWYWDAEFIGFFVAQHLGLYSLERLTVEFLEGGPEVEPEHLLLCGAVDIALTVRETTLSLIAAGADLEVVGAQYKQDPLALLVRACSTISTLADLRGCTVAVPDISRDSLIQSLSRAGIEASTMKFVGYDGSAVPFQDANGVDAVVGYITSLPLDLARSEIPTRSFLLAADTGPTTLQNLIVVRGSQQPAIRHRVRKWLAASAEGWRVNASDSSYYPRALRSTWFNNTQRCVDDEIEHNRRQLEFMGDPKAFLKIDSTH